MAIFVSLVAVGIGAAGSLGIMVRVFRLAAGF
jgi:hypothetical protein